MMRVMMSSQDLGKARMINESSDVETNDTSASRRFMREEVGAA
jgi:hypothetical protein